MCQSRDRKTDFLQTAPTGGLNEKSDKWIFKLDFTGWRNFYFCTDLSCSETSLNRSMKIFHHFPPVTSLINPLSNFFLEWPQNTAFQSSVESFSLRSLKLQSQHSKPSPKHQQVGVKIFSQSLQNQFHSLWHICTQRVSQMSMWKSLGHSLPISSSLPPACLTALHLPAAFEVRLQSGKKGG